MPQPTCSPMNLAVIALNWSAAFCCLTYIVQTEHSTFLCVTLRYFWSIFLRHVLCWSLDFGGIKSVFVKFWIFPLPVCKHAVRQGRVEVVVVPFPLPTPS